VAYNRRVVDNYVSLPYNFGLGGLMLERNYQAQLIKKLKRRFRGCIILKNDSEYLQGVPDLTIFCEDMWAMLEVKASEDSPVRPNQNYYVDVMDKMSYASFIYPENEEAVIHDLKDFFQSG
jgi:hypothetical protein